MEIRDEIIKTARSWLGTKFHHQGRKKIKGKDKGGCDCLGLIVGVATELGLKDFKNNTGKFLADYDNTNYSKLPDGNKFKTELGKILYCKSLQQIEKGDIALIEFDNNPQHVAFISDYDSNHFGLIHCFQDVGEVVEHRLDAYWIKKINSIFSLIKE